MEKWGNCDTSKKDSKCQDPRTAGCLASVWLEGIGQRGESEVRSEEAKAGLQGPLLAMHGLVFTGSDLGAIEDFKRRREMI